MRKLYWNRGVGKFVNKFTGVNLVGASFKGTQREWDETLVETIIDLATIVNTSVCVLRVHDSVADILEATVMYRNGKISIHFGEEFANEYKVLRKYEFKIERSESTESNIVEVLDKEGVIVGEIELNT